MFAELKKYVLYERFLNRICNQSLNYFILNKKGGLYVIQKKI